MEVALNLMTAELSVEVGKEVRLTDMGSALDPKGRGNSLAPGITDSKWLGSTPGPVGTPTRGTGHRENDTVSG